MVHGFLFKRNFFIGSGEMAQWFRIRTPLSEDLTLGPRTNIKVAHSFLLL